MNPKRYATSINLVAYNGQRWLPFCLEALSNQTYKDFFLLVIDNGSLDGSAALIQEFLRTHHELGKRARLVVNKQNLGFSRGHNQAMAWTESDYVLMLNQDVLLDPAYLEHAVRALAADPRVAAVTGKLLRWNFQAASFYMEALPELQAESCLDSAGLIVRRSRRVVERGQGERDHGQYPRGEEVFGVSGAAPVYKREALMDVSPLGEVFDEDFVSYKEDVDLAWRLQRAGYTAWYEPRAVAYHDRSVRGGLGIRDTLRHHHGRPRDLKVYSYVNHLAVLIKNDGWWNLTLDAPWILAHELAKAGYLFLTGPGTLFRAWGRLIAHIPTFLKKRNSLSVVQRRTTAELRKWWTKV